MPGHAEKRASAQGDGRLYGETVLSVIAIVLLLVGVPWVAGAAVSFAYNSGTIEYETRPNNSTGGFVEWVGFEQGPNTYGAGTSGGSAECVPFDGVTSGDYPPAFVGSSAVVLTNPPPTSGGTVLAHWSWLAIGSPFRNEHPTWPYCRTANDWVGLRLDSTQVRTGIGHAMIRFNTTVVLWGSSWPTTPDITAVSAFDWRLDLNGTTVFEKAVGCGAPDSQMSVDNWSPTEPPSTTPGSTSALYPYTIHLDHSLDVGQERAWRDAVAPIPSNTGYANQSTLNMTLWIRGGDFDPTNACTAHATQSQNALGSLSTDDWYIRTELEYLEADNFDLIIRGAAFVMGSVISFAAVASTPFFNPLAKRLRGG